MGLPSPGTLEGIYDAFSPVSVQAYCERSGDELPIDKFQGEQNSQSTIFRQGVYEVDTYMAANTVNWEINEQLQFSIGHIQVHLHVPRLKLVIDLS